MRCFWLLKCNEPIKWNPKNNGKQNLVKIKLCNSINHRLFNLIQNNWTIKTEYRKIKWKWKKTDFRNKTDFIEPYNYNIYIFVVIKIDVSEQ